MKLFLKHIARTVRRSPIQPLLILVTVILSTAVAVTAFRMLFLFEEITEQSAKDESALGDVILSMRGDSDVRLMFCEDVEQTLGDDISVNVCGEYVFTGFYQAQDGTKALSASGVDLEKADAYFQFSFLEYGMFTEQDQRSSAIISAKIAEQYGLTVGSKMTLLVMGENMTYTVQAVVRDEGLFSQRDILISLDGLISVLAKDNPMIAAIGSHAQPYNRICLRLEEKTDVATVLRRLSNAELFSDKQIALTDRVERSDFMVFSQRAAMALMAVVVLFLCALLVATCLQLLQEQRTAESALFYSVGAKKRHLHLLQFTESAIYALLGAVGGIALSRPLINGAWNLFDMPKKRMDISFGDAMFGIFFAVLLMLGCTAICLHRKKRMTVAEWLQKEEHTPLRASERSEGMAVVFIGWLLCILAMIFSPLKHRYLAGIAAILFTAMLMYLVIPILLKQCARLGEWLCDQTKRLRASWLLAQKNIREQHALRNAGRLLSVLIAILVLVVYSSSMFRKQIDRFEHAFAGDLIAVNVGAELERELEKDPRIAATARFDIVTTAVIANDYTVMTVLASGNLDSILYQDFIPQKMPQKHEAVISKGIAMLTQTDVGDAFSVEIDGVSYTFTVCEVQNVHANFVYLNKDAVPTTRDLLGISFSQGAETDEELIRSLYHLLEGQGVVLLDPESLRPSSYRLLLGFSDLLFYATAASILISLSGCANLLFGQYRARRRERELLRMCGMTRAGIARMYAAELLSLILPVILLGAIGGFVMSLMMNYGLHSFGISLFFF